ncbi:MAG TPA: hypothetical protein VGU66_09625 [Candidatus Elarobacter sp.]|nr:hypothetical protein [Candidatus Elarobacter sp.]
MVGFRGARARIGNGAPGAPNALGRSPRSPSNLDDSRRLRNGIRGKPIRRRTQTLDRGTRLHGNLTNPRITPRLELAPGIRNHDSLRAEPNPSWPNVPSRDKPLLLH